jgi:hypothetical protein
LEVVAEPVEVVEGAAAAKAAKPTTAVKIV